MESLILASYVFKTQQQHAGSRLAFDETFQQNARSALSSLAASMAGIVAFVFVLSLLG